MILCQQNKSKGNSKQRVNHRFSGPGVRNRRLRKEFLKTSNETTQVFQNSKEIVKKLFQNKSADTISESTESFEFSEIEPMKEFRPTEEEFKEPLQFIERLYKDGVSKYG